MGRRRHHQRNHRPTKDDLGQAHHRERHEVGRRRLHCAQEHQDEEATQPYPKSSSIELRRTSQTADARGPEQRATTMFAKNTKTNPSSNERRVLQQNTTARPPKAPKIPEGYHRRDLSQNCYGGAGGGAGGSERVCSTRVSVHPCRQVHLIMGAVSLWKRPPALHLCAGPLKTPFNPTPQRRAARTTRSQRFLNRSSCEISTVSFTTAPGNQLNLHNRNIDHSARTATLRRERDVDDLEGLQLRRLHSYLQCEP